MSIFPAILLAVLSTLTIGAAGTPLWHECVHDKVQAPGSDLVISQVTGSRTRRDPEADFSPQRVHVVFDSSINNDLPAFVDPSGPFQRALRVLSNSLMVRPIRGNMTIPPACTNITEGPNTGKCRSGTLRNMCGIFPVPPELVGEREACEGPNGDCFEQGVTGEGVEADYILFTGAMSSEFCTLSESTLAFAASCSRDADSMRPSAGYINICTQNLINAGKAMNSELFFNLVLHELSHAFGFSASLFPNFRDNESNSYNPVQQFEFNGDTIPGITSQRVLETARGYFDCPDLPYVPLENHGITNGQSSHWEARVLHHEVMAAALASDHSVFSNFTWSLFEDSGWYRVNYTHAETALQEQFDLEWGRGLGCPFVLDYCDNPATYPYRCDPAEGLFQCTFDRISRGQCSSSFPFFDGCPVVMAETGGSCLLQSNANNIIGSNPDFIPQLFGRNSRCFEASARTNTCPTLRALGCLDTQFVRHRPSNRLAYSIQGNSTQGRVSCREGEEVSIDQALLECPLASVLALRTDPDDITSVDAVPSTLCHSTCSSCQAIGDSSQCLSCPSGFDLFGSPPSFCNVSVEFGSGSGDGPLAPLPTPTAVTNGLTFLSLGSSAITFTGVDDDSAGPISFPTPLQFGSTMQSEAYISSNGLISFVSPFTSFIPQPFPISELVVAPYWDDVTLVSSGSVQYSLISRSAGQNVQLLDRVEEFLSQEIGNRISASWMLVAKWINVCYSGQPRCDQRNSFQVVIVNAGRRSYAVFTYRCCSLNWDRNDAVIGFSAGNTMFTNHPLSGSPNVNNIACTNVTSSQWTNVIYEISEPITSCSEPDLPTIGTTGLNIAFNDTRIGSSAVYSCISGYNLIGNSTRVCQVDGSWTGTPPYCQIVDCGSSSLLRNGDRILSVTNPDTVFNSTATYSCRRGYSLIGNEMRQCLASGNWSGSLPSCEIVSCGALNPNGVGGLTVAMMKSSVFNTTVVYSCTEVGYQLVGQAERVCEADGQWSGIEPSCELISCGDLSVSNIGAGGLTLQFSAPTMTFGTRAVYSCRSNDHRVSGNVERVCGADGNWTGEEAECRLFRCGLLSVNSSAPGGLKIQFSAPSTVFGTRAVYSCAEGYQIVGLNERICETNGNWSGTEPHCEAIPTPMTTSLPSTTSSIISSTLVTSSLSSTPLTTSSPLITSTPTPLMSSPVISSTPTPFISSSVISSTLLATTSLTSASISPSTFISSVGDTTSSTMILFGSSSIITSSTASLSTLIVTSSFIQTSSVFPSMADSSSSQISTTPTVSFLTPSSTPSSYSISSVVNSSSNTQSYVQFSTTQLLTTVELISSPPTSSPQATATLQNLVIVSLAGISANRFDDSLKTDFQRTVAEAVTSYCSTITERCLILPQDVVITTTIDSNSGLAVHFYVRERGSTNGLLSGNVVANAIRASQSMFQEAGFQVLMVVSAMDGDDTPSLPPSTIAAGVLGGAVVILLILTGSGAVLLLCRKRLSKSRRRPTPALDSHTAFGSREILSQPADCGISVQFENAGITV